MDLIIQPLLPGQARLRYPVEAGLVVRGQVRRAILAHAHTYGLQIQLQEDWGLLESLFRFTFIGPETAILSFQRDLQNWAEAIA